MPQNPSAVVKRSIVIGGHKTSISLEEEFWLSLKDIAHGRGQTIGQLVSGIDAERSSGNLSSALRLFVLQHFRDSSENSQGSNSAK